MSAKPKQVLLWSMVDATAEGVGDLLLSRVSEHLVAKL